MSADTDRSFPTPIFTSGCFEMDFQALKVLQERVEKLAGEMMLADFENEASARLLLDQVQDIADRAESQGLVSESQLCKHLVADFIHPSPVTDGSFESRLGKLVEALQELLGGGFNRKAVPVSAHLSEPGNGWEYCLASLPPYVNEAILQEFIENLGGVLDEVQHLLLSLEQVFNTEKLAELRRHLHTIKSDAGLLGQKEIERLCHLAEDLLRACTDRLAPEPLFLTWDWLKRQLDWVRGSSEAPESPDGILAMLKQAALDLESTPASTFASPTDSCSLKTTGGSEAVTPLDDFDDLFSNADFASGDRKVRFTIPEDSSMLRDFLHESLENLENLDVLLLRLEHPEGSPENVNAVFRAFHTIKGLAGFFALDAPRNLAQQAESILQQCRMGKQSPNGPLLDLLFDCKDRMKRILLATEEALTDGASSVELESLPDLESALETALKEPPTDTAGKGTDERRLGEILLGKNAIDDALLADVLQQQKHANTPRLGDILVAQGMTSRRLVDKAIERQQAGEHHPVGTLLVAERQLDPEDLEAALSIQEDHQQPRLGEVLIRSGQVSPLEVRRALQSQRPRSGGSPGVSESNLRDSVKVDAHRLDLLVDTIGELVIAESMVIQHPDLKHFHRSPAVSRLFGQLDKISRDLQEMATDLRLVSIRPVFDKMARLARDLSRKTSKPLRFHMEGEETMLDKNVVDRIGDPLLHLIRNAVDHGLEADGQARVASGKSTHGNLTLRAWQRSGSIWIEVEDDGKGLDVDSIRATAIRNGLLEPDTERSPAELQQMIFLPGFSTSREITDISGRGVGMDVVAQAISGLRGTIHLDSEPGRGTVFRIQLPLTLAIIEGMLVRAGKQTYVLPIQAITRLVEPGTARIENILGRGLALTQPEGLVPLIRLADLFGMEAGESRNPVLLVMEHLEQRIALQVDEVLGQQQVVIKSLGDGLRGIPGISGGCILADGRVGLILDVGGLQPKGQEFLRHIRAGGLKSAEDGPAQGR